VRAGAEVVAVRPCASYPDRRRLSVRPCGCPDRRLSLRQQWLPGNVVVVGGVSSVWVLVISGGGIAVVMAVVAVVWCGGDGRGGWRCAGGVVVVVGGGGVSLPSTALVVGVEVVMASSCGDGCLRCRLAWWRRSWWWLALRWWRRHRRWCGVVVVGVQVQVRTQT